jgi:predicted adenylyl cyclase CyaB
MKQVEITVRVLESLNEAIEKLKGQGFYEIRESVIIDIYMSQLYNEIKVDNLKEILSNSVLLRTVIVEGKEIKLITYKNKIYDNETVISEEKISIDCDDLGKAQKLFECLKFKEIVTVKYDLIVLKKDDIELAFQDVENLGLFVEFENDNDFESVSIYDIKKEKENMMSTLKKFGLKLGEDYDIKKAQELIKLKL